MVKELAELRGAEYSTTSVAQSLISYPAQLLKETEARKALEDAASKTHDAAKNNQIEAIQRPRGEAGSRTKGFILIEAMELEEDRSKYKDMLVSNK
jgi:hypothetical protein